MSKNIPPPPDLDQQIAALTRLSVPELQDRYAELFHETTRARHKEHLRRKIAWRLQALAHGDLSQRARQRAAELACDADVRIVPPKQFLTEPPVPVEQTRKPDPRLPSVGTVLVREYKGRQHPVTVLSRGFEYDGQRFRSLSAVARAICGSHVNGFRFFGLEETP